MDVARLVADIQHRAAVNRERRLYDATLLSAPFDLAGGEGFDGALALEPVRLRPELGYSSKPVVGPAVTLVKRVVERLVHHVMQDGFDQASHRIEHLARSLEDAELRSEERVESQARALRSLIQREGERRAGVAAETAALAERVRELSEQVARLADRVERLEREGGAAR